MTLEQVFEQIAKKNDLTVVDFQMNLGQAPESRFWVTLHWAGYAKSGNSCEHGFGATIADALRNALESVARDRCQEPVVDFTEILKVAA